MVNSFNVNANDHFFQSVANLAIAFAVTPIFSVLSNRTGICAAFTLLRANQFEFVGGFSAFESYVNAYVEEATHGASLSTLFNSLSSTEVRIMLYLY